MIIKEISTDFPGDPESSKIRVLHPNMEKTAGLSEEIAKYINSLKRENGKVYILVNALSSGEAFGSNKNGDFFPEEVLKKYHKTFEVYGRQYRSHQNSDPEKSYGKVIFSYYHPVMKRVEIVVELDEDKNKDIIESLDSNKPVFTSMGCRVPYDVCSVCGNQAKTRAFYCDHLKYFMNRILEDGRKVYAINTEPKFFDNSFVEKPAEPTAGVIVKIAEESTKLAKNKTAVINKKIPVEIADVDKDPKNLIFRSQKRMCRSKLKKLAQLPMDEVLSSFVALRIMPKPDDFQYLVLTAKGHEKLAEKLDKEKIVFPVIEDSNINDIFNIDKINIKVAQILNEDLDNLITTKPRVIIRLSKCAADNSFENTPGYKREPSALSTFLLPREDGVNIDPVKNPIPSMAVLGSIYYALLKAQNALGKSPESFGMLEQAVMKYPWLLPLLVAGAGGASIGLQKAYMQKSAGKSTTLRNALIAFPASYLYAGVQQDKVQRGEPIGSVGNQIRKHPFATAVLSTLVANKLPIIGKGRVKKAEDTSAVLESLYNLDNGQLNKIYNEFLGGF